MIFVRLILCSAMFLVGGPTRIVDEQEIKKVVEQFVYSKLDTSKEKISIEYRSVPSKVLNIPKEATLRVVAEQHTDLRNGVLLPVEVSCNDRVEHTFLVSLKIRRYARVLIASAKIEKRDLGELIAATEEMMETTTLPPDVITNHDKLKGRRAKRIVKQGTVLTESMFEKIPTVSQGSTVTLLVKTKSVVIKAKAIVREDGGTGDIVEVQKAGTGDRFKARVVDEHTVEMLVQK